MSNSQIGEKLNNIRYLLNIEEPTKEKEITSNKNQEVIFDSGLDSQFSYNRIIFGAPGTGKSFTLNHELKKILGDKCETDYERVTFHPEYSYANFVGTYKPVMVDNFLNKNSEITVKDIISIITDEKKLAAEKSDILYESFKEDGISRLPQLLSLFTNENFKIEKSDTTISDCIELKGDKTTRPYKDFSQIVSRKKDISYEYVPGPFVRVLIKALKNARTDKPRPFVLLIEEINRANVAAVFGDVFQLLDRDDDGVSEYKIATTYDMRKYLAQELDVDESQVENIKIPNNMFIWATMNSADQGVFPMDTAFKRRWDFTYLGIDDNDEKLQGKYVYLSDNKSQKVEWNKLRKAINNFLANSKINEDKQIGPYFISKNIIIPDQGDEIDRERFISAFKNKVIMYLYEDAARQKRSKLFEGCSQNSTRYSQICKEFDKKGVKIFNQDIISECEIEDVESENDDSDN